MKITVILDVSDRLAELIDQKSVLSELKNLERRLDRRIEQIMGSVQDLDTAINALKDADTSGFEAISDAVTELSGDVSRLNDQITALTEKVDNPELQGQIDTLTEEAQKTTDRANSLATAIKDAVETPAADDGGGQ